jgi:membrane protein YqaA with SNARE-associated domain
MTACLIMFVLALISSIAIFIPSEVFFLALANMDRIPPIHVYGGFNLDLSQYSTSFPWLLPIAATLGSNFGTTFYYLIGSGALKITGKLKKKLESFDFDRYARTRDAVVFLSSIISVPPISLTSVASGMIRFNFARFYAITFAGKLIRYCAVLILGRFALDLALKLFG